MSELPLGWATDIAVLEHMGSTIDDRGDHIVVRTPQNPLFHWGNCIFVTDAELELDDVLATSALPHQAPLPDGYSAHALNSDEDWEQLVLRDLAVNDEESQHDRQSHERFARARVAAYRAMSERDRALFVGAFSAGSLVAELGIVRCGPLARYQTVGTDPAHRGRGLCAHLLGVAGAWAGDRGAQQWVIVTAATNPAGRVYRRAGFALAEPIVTAYRPPA
ncbi:hypothetical protein BH09ACT8_BH09ACT8_46810 [soil metagenome]